jgi:hypothetical protein
MWSKKWRGWGDVELMLITSARLPNEKIAYRKMTVSNTITH